jgi:AcrR family transcriptional regulator
LVSQPRPNDDARIPLSRDRVLGAAIVLADAGGIEALSMRRLAQELGVEAMSLYHHVANKDDLLVGMLDIVVTEMELPSAGSDWKRAMRRSAISAHEVLVRHPWACGLLVSGTSGVAPARLRYMDAVLGCLRRGGFSVELTHHAYHALDAHIIGFTLWQLSFPFESEEELQTMAGSFLQELSTDAFPHLAEHIGHHLRKSSDEDQSEFDFGLDLILGGLERLRKRSRRAAKR